MSLQEIYNLPLELFLLFTFFGHLICALYIFFNKGSKKWILIAFVMGLIGIILYHFSPDSEIEID